MSNWLLPESLADILPAEARRIEELRRDLLDLYRTYGFELVAPPLVEYLESLQAVSGTDLNLRTSKVVDQISGRTMGVRADMTPQVARIDAHLLNREGVTRLCYCGSVLHARPAGLLSDRELLQIGAEIFGHAGIESDLEVVQLALESVGRAGVHHPRLDLNYPDLGRFLIERDPILKTRVAEVCELLNAKDVSGLRALGRESGCLPETTRYLLALTSLYGDDSVLERARSVLPDEPEVREALSSLRRFIDAFFSRVEQRVEQLCQTARYAGIGGRQAVVLRLADKLRHTLIELMQEVAVESNTLVEQIVKTVGGQAGHLAVAQGHHIVFAFFVFQQRAFAYPATGRHPCHGGNFAVGVAHRYFEQTREHADPGRGAFPLAFDDGSGLVCGDQRVAADTLLQLGC